MLLPIFSTVLIGLFANSYSSYLELNDKFSELRKNGGHWLIKFYAPWCGHCQRMEPVWTEVGEALIHTNIRVGRIDCSHFPKIASEFGIRGYPTIKFLTSDTEHTFIGDRNKEEIIEFANRVAGPPVQAVTSAKGFDDLKGTNQLFFTYVGSQEGELWEHFLDSARRFQAHSQFYATDEETAKQINIVPMAPSIFVYKDNEPYLFSVADSRGSNQPNLNASLTKWVNEERFGTFQKVTRSNLNDLMQLHRYVVLAVVDENKLSEDPTLSNFKFMLENIIKSHKRKYRKRFIFGWIGNPEFANSIALDTVPLPYLLVLNSTNHYHYIPDGDCSKMTAKNVEIFLESIYNQSAYAYGGNGIGTRLYRAYFETKTAVKEMYQGHPVLTTMLFTIPVLFFTFIFYSLCFADMLGPEDVDDEEEDEDSHLKAD